MLLGLDHEKDEQAGDEEDQEKDNLPLGRLLLVARCHLELFLGRLDIRVHALDIVVDAVEHGALVNDHGLEVAEQIRQINDALGDVLDFLLALGNSSIVGV